MIMVGVKKFVAVVIFIEMPRIQGAALSFRAVDERGNFKHHRLYAHVTLRTVSLPGCTMAMV